MKANTEELDQSQIENIAFLVDYIIENCEEEKGFRRDLEDEDRELFDALGEAGQVKYLEENYGNHTYTIARSLRLWLNPQPEVKPLISETVDNGIRMLDADELAQLARIVDLALRGFVACHAERKAA
jgi:hypothetical protein